MLRASKGQGTDPEFPFSTKRKELGPVGGGGGGIGGPLDMTIKAVVPERKKE